jgi:hypothetical protein
VKIATRVDPYGDEDVPKTKAGVRVIPLGDGVIRELKAWRERTTFKGQDDLVFSNRHGGFYDHRGMVKLKFDPLFVALQKKWREADIGGPNKPTAPAPSRKDLLPEP